MERLTSRDLLAISDVLQRLYAFRDLDSFVAFLLDEIPRLVASEITVYGELDPRAGRFRFDSSPPATGRFPGWQEVYRAHLSEHPFARRYQGGGGGKAVKLSDVITDVRFRDTGLYREFFRRIGVDREMVVWLPAPRPLQVTLAVHRVRHDFRERDRTVLNALRPHLVQAFRNAEAVTLLQRSAAGAGLGVLLLSPCSELEPLDPRALALLERYFGPAKSATLPDTVARWVEHQEALWRQADDAAVPGAPLVVTRDNSRLIVRFFCGPSQRLLLLEEHETAPDPARLEQLGISRREAEILAWVAEGKTNEEIAIILGISRRTVAKHLELMYPKLGVENRTAAVRLALGAMALRPAA